MDRTPLQLPLKKEKIDDFERISGEERYQRSPYNILNLKDFQEVSQSLKFQRRRGLPPGSFPGLVIG